jgi:phosphate transport system substrate-binding protein
MNFDAKAQRRKGIREILCLFASLRLCVFLFIAGCTQPPPVPTAVTSTPPPITLRIGVATAAAAVPDLVAAPYAQYTPHAVLQFIPANTETLLADLAAGQLDAILIHHLPPDSEFWFNPIALDGLVIVVHPDNPVTGLSRAEVQAVFNGRLTNWQSLGGADLPIALISRERGAGARTLLTERVMAEQRIHINAQVAAGNEAMLATVIEEETAVGYSMMASANDTKLLPIDGISPSPNTTASQDYVLTTPLYFVSGAEPMGELRFFLAWLQSDEGQAVLGEKYGRVR